MTPRPTHRTNKGRGKSAASLQLIDAAYDILEEIRPATVRAVCYRLFTLGLIPNMAKNSTNRVSRQLTDAREQGIIPWSWIVDETREAERITQWSNPDEIINAAVRGYRKDYWQSQPHVVEVWSEKGTVRGTLAPVLDKYGVTFRVMHGYGSATTLHDIAQQTWQTDKPYTVLYVGDHDPSGTHMSEVDIPNRLYRYDGVLNIHRVALSSAEGDTRAGLPSFEATTKRTDSRYQWYMEKFGRHVGGQCWELDALSPVILRDRIEKHIRSYLDLDAWNRAIEVEAAERESMEDFAQAWKRSISRQASKYSGDSP